MRASCVQERLYLDTGTATDDTNQPIAYPLAAVVFLTVFLGPYINAEDDRSQRVKVIKGILEAVKTESSFDSSKWTKKTLEGKLKKLAANAKKLAKAGGDATEVEPVD